MRKQILQKTALVILWLTYMLPAVLLLYFAALQKAQHTAMMEKLEEENLITLYLSAKEIYPAQQDNELIIGGKMFDVKKIEEVNSGYYAVTGLFDEQEQQLQKKMKRLMDGNDDLGSNKMMTQLLALIATMPLRHTHAEALKAIAAVHFICYKSRLTAISYPVLLPPPKA